MNEKQQLIKEIEQASDFLVKEVLDFLLRTKDRTTHLIDPSKQENENAITAISHNSEKSLKSLLLAIPDLGDDEDFERKSDLGRDISL